MDYAKLMQDWCDAYKGCVFGLGALEARAEQLRMLRDEVGKLVKAGHIQPQDYDGQELLAEVLTLIGKVESGLQSDAIRVAQLAKIPESKQGGN